MDNVLVEVKDVNKDVKRGYKINQFLTNKKLFNIVSSNKNIDDKIKELLSWFQYDININCTEEGYKNNSLLHIAVLRGDVEIVKLLLQKGASTKLRNEDNKTALDIAQTLDIQTKQEIIDLIDANNKTSAAMFQEQSSGSQNVNLRPSSSVHKNIASEKHIQPACVKESYSPSFYRKRSGTSGIGGQLYETKLLSLFLFRALKDKNIKKFYLGTNIEGLGAFDDIVFRYEEEGEHIPKILFIQAKHKDDPDQNKISIQDLFKNYGDFSLQKYFDSYIKITNKFNNSGDSFFKDPLKHVHCFFIIFTPALENIENKKKDFVYTNTMFDINTSAFGKSFQLDYSNNDVEHLLEAGLVMRTQLLGKTMMKFLFKDNYQNMLTDDLMKAYHVFLAHNVIEIISEAPPTNLYLIGRFRRSFFSSQNWLLKILKETIYNEFSSKYNNFRCNQIETVVHNFSFKLPFNFGNVNFIIGGSDKKIERRLQYICNKIKQMLDSVDSIGSNFVNIDNSMIGPGLILQNTDLEMHRLGGLVGNLFVLDKNTLKLKFNESKESLPPLVRKVFELLSEQYPEEKDFAKYRFHINNYKFPKLTLGRDMSEVRLVEDFFNSLIFFTNQACEDEVEKILKNEVHKCEKFNLLKGNLLNCMKTETIFLKLHDKIQKWWKEPCRSEYLDKKCNYYEDAKQHLRSDSLLYTLQFLFIKKLNYFGIQFRHLDDQFNILINNEQGFLNIVTSHVHLTSTKLIQYLQHNTSPTSYVFVDIDFIASQNCFDEIFSELKEINSKTILFICENINLFEQVQKAKDNLQGFLVYVTNHKLPENVLSNSKKIRQIFDERNAFLDLTLESRKRIISETKIYFQGSKILLKNVIKDKLDIIDSASLCAILNKQIINIGQEFTTTKFEEIDDCYVARSCSRFITLKMGTSDKLFIVNVNAENSQELTGNDNRDIIVVSDKDDDFIKYRDKFQNKNIHWFIDYNENLVWQKSAGSLNIISDCIIKGSCPSYKYNPKTLLDFDEKVVIICAEPGMGKSTLMTYISIQTKLRYPTTWIMRINCLNFKNLFSYWQENNIVIDLKEVIKLLYITNNLLIVKKQKISSHFCDIFQYSFDINITPDGDITLNVNDRELVGLPYFELTLFNYMYNNGNIAIVFDGFDEISPDYMSEVIKLLEILKNSRVCSLWITTRPYNILPNLEQKMGTFAFMLEKISSEDQHALLEMLWAKALGIKRNDRLKFDVSKFFQIISFVIHDKEKEFTSIPLHIFMIADIYVNPFKDFYNRYRISEEYMLDLQALNTLKLYELFVKKKFYKIRFGEKKPYIYDRDPDMKKMIEMKRREFIDVHKKLSAYAIFDKTVPGMFTKQVTKEIHDALEAIKTGDERTGIIDRVVDNEPIFVHLSFAEYFATEYLCDRLKDEECSVDVWIYLLNTIFGMDKRLVRLFFNCKLLADEELFILSKTCKYKREMMDLLLNQCHFNSLNTVLLEDLEKTALFLLYCIMDLINRNNLEEFLKYILVRKKFSCSFCSLLNGRYSKVLTLVLDCVKKIDKSKLIQLFRCGDVPLFNALDIAISYCGFREDRQLLDDLLSSIDDTEIILELFTMPSHMGLLKNTIVHVLIMNRHEITILLKYLLKFNKDQLMKIFSVLDVDGKLAAHYAAENGDQQFFITLSDLLDRDQLRTICRTIDNTGRTPLAYLQSSINPDFQNILYSLD